MSRNLRYFIILPAVVIAVIALIFMATSNGEVHEGDLVGLYVLNKKPPIEILELKSDGSYVHSYQEQGIPEETGTGRWALEFMHRTHDRAIFLYNYQSLPKRSKKENAGFTALPISLFFGSIRLVDSFDLGHFFEKL